jgi:hypothetical protein
MTIRNLLLCTALALIPACSKGGGNQIDKMMDMMDEMGNVVDDAKGDCGKMAEGLEKVVGKYDLKAMKEEAEKMKADKEKSKEIMTKYADRMGKVMPKMMGMMKCADYPKMKEMQEKLKGVM